MDDGTRWLTYQELADARDINRRSAVRLAQRRRWLRRRGNDGTTRVAVPVGEDQPKHDDRGDDARDIAGDDAGGDVRGDGSDIAGEDAGDISRVVSALEVVIAPLREQLKIANRRAENAEQERNELRADLARAEERLRQAEIDRLVADAAERSSLFSRLWRRRS
jgi:hypothetical protein